MTMSQVKTDWIWKDGELVPWDSAQLHVMSHVVHYGSSVFEGIRFYDTPDGPAVFRLKDHMRRFEDSCRIYRMEVEHDHATLVAACREITATNNLESGYIRPISFRGVGALGVHPGDSPIETYIVAYPWGPYLGTGALNEGVDVCVSSWNRPAPNSVPAMAKAGGTYLISQLMKMEAVANGFSEAIGMGVDGRVSEGSAQNLFVVSGGVLRTPEPDGSLLCGITRDSVLTLAADLGIPAREQPIPREMLYVADELFFTGTASEITPIRSVDRIPARGGAGGPVTRQLQDAYISYARGQCPDVHGWLDLVREPAGVS